MPLLARFYPSALLLLLSSDLMPGDSAHSGTAPRDIPRDFPASASRSWESRLPLGLYLNNSNFNEVRKWYADCCIGEARKFRYKEPDSYLFRLLDGFFSEARS